ncbi:nuclear transport factor 2 family protein [Nocardioides jensenii]|uniref:nuclear transport factor 2 family protein n=1 Tax=Nocardioides jensenii TaxID=1843 RepID=UPI00082F8DB4|nr:nuclear transport factor 2 family protein [Nocardioides jensenii]
MPTRDQICAALASYVEHHTNHDVDRLVAMFADDAVLHEPLGVRTYRGAAEIRAFATQNALVDYSVSLLSPITVSGRYAGVQLRVHRDGIPDFATTDLFEFDDEGRIASLSVILDPESLA